MSDTKEKIIFKEDSDIVELVNVNLWKSKRTGKLFQEEMDARVESATHSKCQICGGAAYKFCAMCENCRSKYRYDNATKVEWDEVTPIYADSCDRYFNNIDDLVEFLYEDCTDDDPEPIDVNGLHLFLCKPNYLREIDPSHWEDAIPDSDDYPDPVPAEVYNALDQLNSIISKLKEDKHAMSWNPDYTTAIIIDKEYIKHFDDVVV